MKKNITRVEALNLAISALSDNTDAVEVLTSIRDTITKANSRKSDKPTKTQQANMDIKSRLIAHLSDGNRYSVADIVKAFDNEYSSQKVSALLRQLILAGEVVREEDKRKALFRLA